MLDCAIIGAGPAGLAAARCLLDSGLTVKVLEADDCVGGRTKSVVRSGHILDYGAAFITSFYDATLQLCRTTGVELARPNHHPGRSRRLHCLLINGNLIPHRIGSPFGFFRFPYIPARQKLITVWTVLNLVARYRLHIADINSLAARDHSSAFTWGLRELGREAYTYVVRLSFEPFFYYEAKYVSQAFVQALLRHSVSWRLFSPPKGMGNICESLAYGLPVVTGAKVWKIQNLPQGLSVNHSRGVEYTRTAILAIPPSDALCLDAPFTRQDLSDLSMVQYVPSVRVNFGYNREGVLNPPVITPAGKGLHPIAGVSEISRWMKSRISKGNEIVRISATAKRSEQLLQSPAGRIAQALESDCRAMGIHLPTPDWMEAVTITNAIVKTPPGHFRRSKAFLNRPREKLFFAGDWLTGSTIEGAVRTGLSSAKAAKYSLGRH